MMVAALHSTTKCHQMKDLLLSTGDLSAGGFTGLLNTALSIAVSLCVVVVANVGSRPGSWRRRGQERGGEVREEGMVGREGNRGGRGGKGNEREGIRTQDRDGAKR